MRMNEVMTIQNRIFEIRGQRVMLDRDLAELYGVETKQLVRQVKRNIERFEGEDFMFELTNQEYNTLITSLRCQIGTSNRGGNRYGVLAFTEQGVSMLSSVLRSSTAIKVNRAIIRTFVAMRNYMATSAIITAELAEIKAKLALMEKNDEENMEAVNDLSEDIRSELDNIYEAIAALSIKQPKTVGKNKPIGFKTSTSNNNQ